MNSGLLFSLGSVAVAVAYGTLFRVVYPRIELDAKLYLLFAVAGALTVLLLQALAKLAAGNKPEKP